MGVQLSCQTLSIKLSYHTNAFMLSGPQLRWDTDLQLHHISATPYSAIWNSRPALCAGSLLQLPAL